MGNNQLNGLGIGASFMLSEQVLPSSSASLSLPRLDRPAIVFIIFIITVFAILVGAGFNRSSMALFRASVGSEPYDSSLLLGAPHPIRGDEWATATPGLLGQLRVSPPFSASNPSIGGGLSPIAMGLPTDHITTLLRPQMYGFFLLDPTRGFAWYWFFPEFFALLVFFMFLRILTGNCFSLSVAGSVWLVFSPYLQWWSMSPAIMLSAWTIFGVISFLYLLASPFRILIVLGGTGILVSAVNSVLVLYPPWQVVIGYLGIGLTAVLYWCIRKPLSKKSLYLFRIISFVFFVSLTALFLGKWFLDMQETIALVNSTVYPGKRVSVGGMIPFWKYFSGLGDYLLSEESFPPPYGNVCETASFLLLPMYFPLLFVGCIWSKRKPKGIPVFLSCYLVAVVGFMVVGIPEWLSKSTFLYLVPANRALMGLGIASVFLTLYIAAHNDKRRMSLGWLVVGVLSLAYVAVGVYSFQKGTFSFLSGMDLALVMLATILFILLFLLGKLKYAVMAIALFQLISSITIHPLVMGISSITEHPLYKKAVEIENGNGKGRWIVFGSFIAANLLRATGADIISGTKYVPIPNDMRVLDPEKVAESVWSRFAQVSYQEQPGQMSASFYSYQPDAYVVTISPVSSVVYRLGVRYLVFPGEPIGLSSYGDALEYLGSAAGFNFYYLSKTR